MKTTAKHILALASAMAVSTASAVPVVTGLLETTSLPEALSETLGLVGEPVPGAAASTTASVAGDDGALAVAVVFVNRDLPRLVPATPGTTPTQLTPVDETVRVVTTSPGEARPIDGGGNIIPPFNGSAVFKGAQSGAHATGGGAGGGAGPSRRGGLGGGFGPGGGGAGGAGPRPSASSTPSAPPEPQAAAPALLPEVSFIPPGPSANPADPVIQMVGIAPPTPLGAVAQPVSNSVPVPGTLLLLGVGLAGLALRGSRIRH